MTPRDALRIARPQRNRAADVPTSGATMCGLPRVCLGDELGQEGAPRALETGDRLDAQNLPNPGRSMANRRACCASVRPHRRERVEALRPRASSSTTTGSCGSAAVGIADLEAVDRCGIAARSTRSTRCSWRLLPGEQRERGPRWRFRRRGARSGSFAKRLRRRTSRSACRREEGGGRRIRWPQTAAPNGQSVPELSVLRTGAEQQPVTLRLRRVPNPQCVAFVEQPRVPRRDLVPEYAVEQLLGDQRRCLERSSPAHETFRGLQPGKAAAAVVPVTAIERRVPSRGCAGRARGNARGWSSQAGSRFGLDGEVGDGASVARLRSPRRC